MSDKHWYTADERRMPGRYPAAVVIFVILEESWRQSPSPSSRLVE